MNIKARYTAGKITVTEFCNDIAGHKIITEFSESGALLSRRAEYLFGIPAPVKDIRLLPLCFFEAVRAGAYKEAASYLSPPLRESIPAGVEEFFNGFFGEFVFAYHEQGGAIALIYKKENGYETKLFIAEIEDNLISNFKTV